MKGIVTKHYEEYNQETNFKGNISIESNKIPFNNNYVSLGRELWLNTTKNRVRAGLMGNNVKGKISVGSNNLLLNFYCGSFSVFIYYGKIWKSILCLALIECTETRDT